jgi:hypothetical protein
VTGKKLLTKRNQTNSCLFLVFVCASVTQPS